MSASTSPRLIAMPESPFAGNYNSTVVSGPGSDERLPADQEAGDSLTSAVRTSPMSIRASAFSIASLISRKREGSLAEPRPEKNASPLTDKLDSVVEAKRCRPSPPATVARGSAAVAVSAPVSGYQDKEMKTVQCHLEGRDLWKKFNELGTEMIITKSGRRMFPVVRVSFTGLNPTAQYLLALDIVPVDQRRYRYAYHRSSWLVAGKAEGSPRPRTSLHPDSCWTGEQLMRQTVPFDRVKLTNNPVDKHGYIILNSMHKYQPRVHLIRSSNVGAFTANSESPLKSFRPDQIKTFLLTETSFIAVTAYQNQLITKLKIDCNPFAKGFRDSSRLTEFERDSVEALLNCQSGKKNYLRESFCPLKTCPNELADDSRKFPTAALTGSPGNIQASISPIGGEMTAFQSINAGQHFLLNQMSALGRFNLSTTVPPSFSLFPHSGIDSSSWARYLATMATVMSPQYPLTTMNDYRTSSNAE